MHARHATALLLLAAGIAAASPRVVGGYREPGVVELRSGPFVTADVDDLLVVRDLGEVKLPTAPGRNAEAQRSLQLSLVRMDGDEPRSVWQSRPLFSGVSSTARLSGNPWTAGDIDRDGLLELLVFSGEEVEVVSFGPESLRTLRTSIPGAWVAAATVCDIDADSAPELVTLELSEADRYLDHRLVRVYDFEGDGFAPATPYVAGLAQAGDATVDLLGSCRLEDYHAENPVFIAEYADLKPSTYGILYMADSARFEYTSNPFPWQEWFTKDEPLPAGPLRLFNVGDTLVAHGYFVPGNRPGGPSESFAALQDGAWRLLTVRPGAWRIASPLCRFRFEGEPGWLELRDGLFRFYPGEVFDWRDAEPEGPGLLEDETGP